MEDHVNYPGQKIYCTQAMLTHYEKDDKEDEKDTGDNDDDNKDKGDDDEEDDDQVQPDWMNTDIPPPEMEIADLEDQTYLFV